MLKFFITGCTGFVAGYLIDYILKNCVDSSILGIATSDEFFVDSEKFIYKQLNMLDSEALTELLDEYRPDYIVHLASNSSVGKSWINPVETFQNNTNIFLNLVESVRTLGVKTRILSIGSSEVYDISARAALTEDFSLDAKNPYAVARLAQELISKLYTSSYGLDIVMTRSFNHSGPKQLDTFVISSFIKQLVQISQGKAESVLYVGNIEVERDFLDVRDVATAYYGLLMFGKTAEIYNVCSGKGRKLKDIIATASKLLGVNVEIRIDETRLRPNEVASIVGDNKKIKNELGWLPTYSLEQTIADMITYYKEQV